jgi:hypothetical protein
VKSVSTAEDAAYSLTTIGPMTVMSSASGPVSKTTTSARDLSGRKGAFDGGKRGFSRWSYAPSLRRADEPPPIVGTGLRGS